MTRRPFKTHHSPHAALWQRVWRVLAPSVEVSGWRRLGSPLACPVRQRAARGQALGNKESLFARPTVPTPPGVHPPHVIGWVRLGGSLLHGLFWKLGQNRPSDFRFADVNESAGRQVLTPRAGREPLPPAQKAMRDSVVGDYAVVVCDGLPKPGTERTKV